MAIGGSYIYGTNRLVPDPEPEILDWEKGGNIMKEKIPVFDKDNRVVTEVNSSDGYSLDNDGWIYRRLTKLWDGRYALTCISYLCCDRNISYVITPAEALTLILESNNEELLEREEFSDLENEVRNTLVVPRPFDIVPQVLFE